MDQTSAGSSSVPWTVGDPLLIALRQRLRRVVSRHSPYLAFKRLRMPAMVVNQSTGLVIEGFPRCGNSYAEAAIRLLHREPRLELAHHTHSVIQVRKAVALGVPTLILFRHPVDAVASLLLLQPRHHTPRHAFLDYADFYRSILSVRDDFLLASFETVTRDFPSLARALQQRFGIRMDPCGDLESRQGEIFQLIDDLTRKRGVGDRVEYSPDNQPEVTAERAAAKERTKKHLRDHAFLGAKETALDVYRSLSELASPLR